MRIAPQCLSRHLPSLIPALALAMALVACAAQSPLTDEFLDTRTGVTVTRVSSPLVLYRDNPSLAAYARNFVHLGPIEVNRTGSFHYYIWLGVWSTMETPTADRIRDEFDSVTIFVDGEPMLLQLAGSTPEAIGTSRPVYLKPVSSAADGYYPVTADQIRLIAEARDIRLRTSGASPREYQPWDDQRVAYLGFQEFLKSVMPW